MLECLNPNYIRKSPTGEITLIGRNEYITFAEEKTGFTYYESRCGHCLACKLYKCYQKSSRLMIEAANRKYTYFITLTFTDDIYDLPYLLKDPLREGQLFIKRLRKKFPYSNIKYFLTGELGSGNKRYHYHAIIFSDHGIFEDMYKIGETAEKRPLFTSNTLRNLWGRGRVSVDYGSEMTMKYVSNYVQDASNSVKHSFSKGIGDDYIEKYLDHNSTRAIICGNRYQLSRTQMAKLNIKKGDYTPNTSQSVSVDIRKRNNKLLHRRFYRK